MGKDSAAGIEFEVIPPDGKQLMKKSVKVNFVPLWDGYSTAVVHLQNARLLARH